MAVALAPGLSRKLKKVLEARTDSPDLLASLNTLSSFYTNNNQQARRNLRSTIEKRALAINEEFLSASESAQKALDAVELEVAGLAECCEKIAKALNSCSAATGDIISTTERLKQELENTTQRQEIVSCFLRDYQLSQEEVNALREEELNENFFKALSRVQEIHANCKMLLRTHHQRAGLELMDMMAVYQEGAYERLCRWVQAECRNLGDNDTPEVSDLLKTAARCLKERPVLFKYCGLPSLPSRRQKRTPSDTKKKAPSENGKTPTEAGRKSLGSSRSSSGAGERTVKRLRLSKALTIPEATTVLDACRRMATRRVDAALLTDTNALLCGIITDKDVATRVIAEGLKPAETSVSKVMTKNPVFVMANTLAVDALTKMVQGKFRHLPVVENGEVIALLDITKCLYDAIARMERAAEKGNAIVAAVEGVERQWGSTTSVPNTFIETLRERMFRPSIATVITEHTKVAKVLPTESVYTATKKMQELRMNAAVVTIENKPRGILTSKDVLMRVVAQNLSPESTLVEKVMTPNPECVTIDTTIVDALHIMHDGKFLHLPVVDRDGFVVACIDVLQITHAAVATVGSSGAVGNDMTSSMMQKFWDSALALEPTEDYDDSHSDASARMASETTEMAKAGYPSLGLGNPFGFKLEDRKGRVHRFNCGTESLTELISAVIQRVGDDIDRAHLPQILYEDDEGDKVLLATDSDLVVAVNYARLAGLKGLRLHLDYSNLDNDETEKENKSSISADLQLARSDSWGSAYTTFAAGAALVAGLGVMAYLKRSTY